jgi:hypothetical protein
MPRPSKGARLYKRKARFHGGKIVHQAVWIIKRATKKRHPPAPIQRRLLAHLRRWKGRKLIATCFVEFNGKPVASVKTQERGAAHPPER